MACITNYDNSTDTILTKKYVFLGIQGLIYNNNSKSSEAQCTNTTIPSYE